MWKIKEQIIEALRFYLKGRDNRRELRKKRESLNKKCLYKDESMFNETCIESFEKVELTEEEMCANCGNLHYLNNKLQVIANNNGSLMLQMRKLMGELKELENE